MEHVFVSGCEMPREDEVRGISATKLPLHAAFTPLTSSHVRLHYLPCMRPVIVSITHHRRPTFLPFGSKLNSFR